MISFIFPFLRRDHRSVAPHLANTVPTPKMLADLLSRSISVVMCRFWFYKICHSRLQWHIRRASAAPSSAWNKRVRPFCICFTVYAWRNVTGLRGTLRGTLRGGLRGSLRTLSYRRIYINPAAGQKQK
jgi:hypothetical protein